jgi:hypothetical protein
VSPSKYKALLTPLQPQLLGPKYYRSEMSG